MWMANGPADLKTKSLTNWIHVWKKRQVNFNECFWQKLKFRTKNMHVQISFTWQWAKFLRNSHHCMVLKLGSLFKTWLTRIVKPVSPDFTYLPVFHLLQPHSLYSYLGIRLCLESKMANNPVVCHLDLVVRGLIEARSRVVAYFPTYLSKWKILFHVCVKQGYFISLHIARESKTWNTSHLRWL